MEFYATVRKELIYINYMDRTKRILMSEKSKQSIIPII